MRKHIGKDTLILVGAEDMFYIYPNGDKTYIIVISYICYDFSGELITETDETLDLQWFDLESLPENISPPVRKSLSCFVEKMKQR